MNHRLKRSQVLTKLVDQGPNALPYLLNSLDDKTPTKLTIEHSGGFGSMWYDGDDGTRNSITEYTVTVGDLCYVIIGQITNRPYVAVRYQPTACIVIHSPSQDNKLADEIRKRWNSSEPVQMLWESLNEDVSDPHLQAGAIVRLGHYFPVESEHVLVDVISKIDCSDAKKADYSDVELVKAIATSRNENVW